MKESCKACKESNKACEESDKAFEGSCKAPWKYLTPLFGKHFCSFENSLLGYSRSLFQKGKPRRPMPISMFFESQCPKIMVLAKALKAKLSSIPSEVVSLSTSGLNRSGKPPLWAFVRPPAVATLPCAWGLLEALLDDMCVRGPRGAPGVLSLGHY